MKKTEIILGIIAFISLFLDIFFIPSGHTILILSLSSLAVIYGYFGFALINNIRFRNIFKKKSYKGISAIRIIGAVLTGFALAVTIIGILFSYMLWPGGLLELYIGLIGLAIALIVGFIRYLESKSKYYIRIFKRIAVFGGLGIILIVLPKYTLLELHFRNYPDYIEAKKKAIENPKNKDLWDKVEEERQKIKKIY